MYQERCPKKRALFHEALAKLPPESIVYMDEAGIDNRLFREYARAPRGQKVYADIPGKKRERVSVIGALKGKQFFAPFTFQGSCNTQVFNIWIKQVLLPELPQGSTLILDNATFHQSSETRQLMEEAGCHLLFLPPYSPDLNPIEHCWHQIKSRLRPLIQKGYEDLQSLVGYAIHHLNNAT